MPLRLVQGVEAAAWDRFLLSTPSGQYQQSSAWAVAKAYAGWRSSRWALVPDGGDAPAAGFQVIWRTKGPLRIGILSKGPVLSRADGLSVPAVRQSVLRAARTLRLAALIMQPPDDQPWEESDRVLGPLHRREAVLSATVCVPLNRQVDEIERAISRNVLREVRKARAAGVSFRQAHADESRLFFDLMSATCRRQGVPPNPGHPAAIEAMLTAFGQATEPTGRISARLLLAEAGGTPVAATLLIRFGDRVTELKKGWLPSAALPVAPNKVLVHEGLLQSRSEGATLYDFAGISRSTAERLVAGEAIRSFPIPGADEFKLHFGGQPRLQPEARVWFRWPFMSWLYRRYASLATSPAR